MMTLVQLQTLEPHDHAEVRVRDAKLWHRSSILSGPLRLACGSFGPPRGKRCSTGQSVVTTAFMATNMPSQPLQQVASAAAGYKRVLVAALLFPHADIPIYEFGGRRLADDVTATRKAARRRRRVGLVVRKIGPG